MCLDDATIEFHESEMDLAGLIARFLYCASRTSHYQKASSAQD